MPEHVLDTVVLRVLAFAHPSGIAVLLEALAASVLRFPAEVYNRDEDTLPLDVHDEAFSELARGLRYARRRVLTLPATTSIRYACWLENVDQLTRHLDAGRLVVGPLLVEELPRREGLIQRFGIGRGEAAGLVLVERYGAEAVFLSSDEPACRVARQLGLGYLTLQQVLELESFFEQTAHLLEETRDVWTQLVAALQEGQEPDDHYAYPGLREKLAERA